MDVWVKISKQLPTKYKRFRCIPISELITVKVMPMTAETRAKRHPDYYREGKRVFEASKKISGRQLKPVHRQLLTRLLISEGLWVDANALGYMNNPSNYNDITHTLDLTDQLNAALYEISHYIQGTEYRLDKMKIGRRIGKVRLKKAS